MQLWRFLPWRSTRLQGWWKLRKQREVRGWAWARTLASSWLAQADWRLAGPTALLLSIPLGWYVGKTAAHWLDGAWAVSAVLVGFDIALIIFLLQLAAGQSLRAEPAFRALLNASGVVWPVAFSLVFIGWVGVIELAAHELRPVPRAIDIYTLVYFVIQVGLFAWVFIRALQLVAPAGVARAMRRAQADGVRRSVEAGLRRAQGDGIFRDACQAAGFSTELSLTGARILTDRAGVVADLDLALAGKLAKGGLAATTQVVTRLGMSVREDTTFARVAGPESHGRAEQLRKSIYIQRRQRVSNDWLSIFREAVNLARRALAEQVQPEEALGIVLAGLEELPRAYATYGIPYETALVRDPFRQGVGDQVLDELKTMSHQVFRTGSDTSASEMPRLAYRMVSAGITQDATFLIQQGLELWLAQAADARRSIGDTDVSSGLIDQISAIERDIVRMRSRTLEDRSMPFAQREMAAGHLIELFQFEMYLLKQHIDATDIKSYNAVVERASEWNRYWRAEQALGQARGELATERNPTRRSQLATAVDEAQRIVELWNKLVAERDWGRFKLGVWLLWRYLEGHVEEEAWKEFYPYLAAAFGSTRRLSAMLREAFVLTGRLEGFESWALATEVIRTNTARYGSRLGQPTELWATLLLLRNTQPGQEPEFEPPEGFMYWGKDVMARIEEIEQDTGRWEPVINGQLSSRAQMLRAAVQAAIESDTERAEEQIAAARIPDEGRIAFARNQLEGFAQANGVHELLKAAAALQEEVTEHAFSGPAERYTLDKRIFLEPNVFFLLDQPGAEAAQRQQEKVFNALRSAATETSGPPDAITAAATSISDMRSRGIDPDAVLAPRDFDFTMLSRQHPAFRWPERRPDGAPQQLGLLSDVPIVAAGPEGSDVLLVVSLAQAMTLIERRTPEMSQPLRVDVHEMTPERAAELIAADDRENLSVEKVTRLNVEAYVDTDDRVQLRPGADQAVMAVKIPPETD